MFVTARNTAFTYRPIDTKQIGREPGVRYVLKGSVRRAESPADRCRERRASLDRALQRRYSYLFTLQDEITSRIAAALNLELIGAEAARPTEHLDALDYILRRAP